MRVASARIAFHRSPLPFHRPTPWNRVNRVHAALRQRSLTSLVRNPFNVAVIYEVSKGNTILRQRSGTVWERINPFGASMDYRRSGGMFDRSR